MSNNARRGIELNKERGGRCATPVGKRTASLLASGKPLSKERVIRMYKYTQRAETYYDPANTKACGTISYLLWGGKAAKRWSEMMWNRFQKEESKRSKLHAMDDIQNEQFEVELRNTYGDKVESRVMELRASGDSTEMVLEGYAARFDETTNLGYFNERIARGAFDDVLNDDVRFLLDHKGMPMARTSNGSLELRTDDNGLFSRAVLNDTQQSRDVYNAVKRGDISSMSFAFTIAEDEMDSKTNTRTVKKVKSMFDVSAVAFPAYPTTTIEARNMAQGCSECSAAQIEADVEAEIQAIVEDENRQKTSSETVATFVPQPHHGMNLNDLKGQRAAYYEEFVAIGKLADEEGRAMTEAEQERADTLDGHITAIDQKIKHKVREQEMVKRVAYATAPAASEDKEVSAINHRWSLSRAVNQIRSAGRLEGAEAEWATEARREYRDSGIQMAGEIGIPGYALLRDTGGATDSFKANAVSTATDGSGFVATDVPGAIAALRAPTVLESMGAQVIQAQGNVMMPRISAKATPSIWDEISDVDSAGMQMDEVNLTPQRAACNTTYSKQLLIQGGPTVDAVIAQDIRGGMAAIVDTYGFNEIMGDGSVDDQSTASTTDTSVSAAIATAMEAAVLAAGGDLSAARYVMSPTAYRLFKTTALVPSVEALFSNGLFNGYPATPTPYLADETAGSVGQAIFGNFAQGLIIAYFGGIDILVDPFSKAQNAQVQLHATRYFDVAVRQPGAFSIINDVAA